MRGDKKQEGSVEAWECLGRCCQESSIASGWTVQTDGLSEGYGA